MREIDGFVFVGQLPSSPFDVFIFGPEKRGRDQKWSNFTSNGLTPFRTRSAAKSAAKQCQKVGHLTNFRFGHIRMRVGETPEEWQELLAGDGPWVIVSDIEGRQELRGTYRVGCLPKAIPGGDLQMNGMEPFSIPDQVLYIRYECQRQFQAHANVATFRYEEIEKLP